MRVEGLVGGRLTSNLHRMGSPTLRRHEGPHTSLEHGCVGLEECGRSGNQTEV